MASPYKHSKYQSCRSLAPGKMSQANNTHRTCSQSGVMHRAFGREGKARTRVCSQAWLDVASAGNNSSLLGKCSMPSHHTATLESQEACKGRLLPDASVASTGTTDPAPSCATAVACAVVLDRRGQEVVSILAACN